MSWVWNIPVSERLDLKRPDDLEPKFGILGHLIIFGPLTFSWLLTTPTFYYFLLTFLVCRRNVKFEIVLVSPGMRGLTTGLTEV